MTELKVHLSKSLNDRFRRIAMSVYGYGRGSLSKAAEDAFSKWCEQHERADSSPIDMGIAGTSSGSSETKKPHVDPEERTEAFNGTDTPTGVKSGS